MLSLASSFTPLEISSQSSVYLCNSSNAKKYHYTKNCRGLSNCKHQIIKVSVQEAKKRGKTLCGWED
ncbi:MAG: hypothetical protein GX159_04280 [Flavobacteriaceae bacterium]|nr:hypothetical protein [Flavobacteriaceae bacterium]